jgi:hypothetical protein
VPAPWPVGRDQLKERHCAFNVDRVAHRPDVTDFKRRARWQQAWWREEQGLPIGSHRSRSSDTAIPNGSKLDEAVARATGANFLSPAIRLAVEDRLALPQQSQTLDEARLWSDLLSSMPLCFNLFGELHNNPSGLLGAIDRLWPEHPGRGHDVVFEWSPGRRDPLYSNNRSAFDAALLLTMEDGRGIIGIETKYHEDIRPERPPDAEKRLPRYREVTERSGAFRDGWESLLIGTELQQLWLDHLLLLSMRQHPNAAWSWGRFVVVYPKANPSVRDAVARYEALLANRETFEARTIEELLDAHVLHAPSTEAAFRQRYLW